MDLTKGYRINDHIRWTTEVNCVKIYDVRNLSVRSITFPDMVLWDLVQQEYPVEQIISMVSVILKTGLREQKAWICQSLDQWQQDELIKLADG